MASSYMAGAFGRHFLADAAIEAVLIAQYIGLPLFTEPRSVKSSHNDRKAVFLLNYR